MSKGAWPLLAATLLLAVTACDIPWSHRDSTLTAPPDNGGGATAPSALPPPEGDAVPLPEAPPQGSEEVDIEVERDGDSLTVKETIRAPDGSSWLSDAANDEQRRLDMEACYDYSRAQVRRDEQIYSDQNAGWNNINNDSRYSFLQEQQTGYGFEVRKDRLFSSCMETKGYNRL